MARATYEQDKGEARGLRALGLVAFGIPLSMASTVWAGLFAQSELAFAIPLAIVLGASSVATAGLSYRSEDSFGGTALRALGAFWLSWGALQVHALGAVLDGGADRGALIATFFGVCAVVALLLFIAAWTDNVADMLVLGGATLTFAALAAGYGRDNASTLNIAGRMGIATAAVCASTVLADVVNDALHRTVLPVVPFRAAPR